jgi:regulator of cell morphogenesis and NO signaling
MAEMYKEADKISDLISDDYRLLQVMSRFGLAVGFGEKTVKEVCEKQKVNFNTFLAVANFTKYGDKVANDWIEKVSVRSLTNYLRLSHSYYLDFMLPNIRRKLIEAIDCSGHNEVAFLILKFYDEYVSEVRKHLESENTKVFPYIDELLEGHVNEQIALEMTMLHQEPIEQKLSELKNIIIKYYTPTNNGNLLNTVLFDIFICEEDLYTHYRMEESLFLPAVHLLEEKKMDEETTTDDSDEDYTDILSDREKDIIIGVVKGLTNKEIADNLFISLNTVTTHRRNIARKLNIHSSAGLTIYAIVNKLIDINEVKGN